MLSFRLDTIAPLICPLENRQHPLFCGQLEHTLRSVVFLPTAWPRIFASADDLLLKTSIQRRRPYGRAPVFLYDSKDSFYDYGNCEVV